MAGKNVWNVSELSYVLLLVAQLEQVTIGATKWSSAVLC